MESNGDAENFNAALKGYCLDKKFRELR